MSPHHLSVEQISDLLEGVLPAAEAMAARTHVATCDHCSQLSDDIRGVSSVLATEAAEEWPMPQDVVVALDAVLDRALAERACAVVPLDAARRRRLRLGWLAAAAAAVVLAGTGYAGWQALAHGGSSTTAVTRPHTSTGSTGGPGHQGATTTTQTPTINMGNGSHRIRPLTPAQVPVRARWLMAHPGQRVAPRSVGCDVPVLTGVSTVVSWQGRDVVLLANPGTRQAWVLDCGTARRPLFRATF
jgi:hypothetical protein